MDELPIDYFVQTGAFTRVNHRDVYPAIDPSSAALAQSQAGKVIIITGASRGLGRKGFAASFARAGAKALVLIARSASKLAETAADVKAINPKVETLTIPTDISNEASVIAAFAQIKEKYGSADVLVSNAAYLDTPMNLGEIDISSWWKGFEINVLGTVIVTKAFLQLIGPSKPATIVTLTSGVAFLVIPGMSGYSLTKAVTNQISAYLEAEYPHLTSVSLHPGTVMTDMTVDSFSRFCVDTPELVGAVGVWLSTGDKKFLSGRYITVNWDAEELVARKEEIVKGNKLKLQLSGEFGQDQFK